MLKEGQTIELTLESLAYEGDAVGHHQGQAVFMPFGVPGDAVRVKVTDARKTYCRADIVEIVKPSEQRVTPACPHFGVCGGCQWQMLEYSAQLEQKKKILHDSLTRIGGIAFPEIQILPDRSGWQYRNKAQFPVSGPAGKLAAGYYRRGTHDIAPVEQCPIVDERINRAWPRLVSLLLQSGLSGYDETSHQGVLRHVILRSLRKSGTLSLSLVTNGEYNLAGLTTAILAELPEIESIWNNVNARQGNAILGGQWRHLAGNGFVSETVGGFEFRLSPGSFLQVNLPQAEVAYRAMSEFLNLSSEETALDLYCGAGTIAFHLAAGAKRVIGIESGREAVDDAVASAAQNGISNCEFRAGQVEQEIAKVGKADVITLDPPRKGADAALWPEVGRLAPRAVAYLSCNPATFARDAKALAKTGYRLAALRMTDLFPQTYHVESLGIFERVRRIV
ncbi:MAG: 23S rRNA (uracil(1939)-C(5))-methyltransferase RlmD [Candidatus Edwardsbacteria bacterium]|nr:23S rRNA (uracil(1939)-C(5))-methyltransferase RlmD [Candidatus Edwardsbacteria bacterium]